ncbi:MAG: type II toxin-antitoxin system ParD family antitoxin [Candidatus Thiodiazotropha endolucinida]
MRSEKEEHETKLTTLRARLQEGEKSPLVEDFDFEAFLDELHNQHTQDC